VQQVGVGTPTRILSFYDRTVPYPPAGIAAVDQTPRQLGRHCAVLLTHRTIWKRG